MIDVSSTFRTLSNAAARDVECKLVINGTAYSSAAVTSLKIYRSIGDSGMAIGNTISDHISVALISALIPSGQTVKPYVRFGSEDWVQLGEFFVTQSQATRETCEFEAYDKMYMLDKRCTFQGNGGTLAALEFPATMQQMLDYICTLRGLTCEFECQPFIVQSRPTYDADAYGDNKYYTQRDIISFIASAHGANARFRADGSLDFTVVGQSAETINAADCVSQTIDHEEGFTVKGIRFIVGNDEIYISDDGSVYSDDLEGIIQIDNPLASIEIAEYVWNTLGGFTYYTCSLERRGRGYFETGDVITVYGFGGLYSANIVVQSLEYEISRDAGFIERIECTAETSTESANRGASGATSSPSSAAVYYDANGAAITIPSDVIRQINAISFAAKVNCIPLYATTVQLDITTAGTVKLYVIYDSGIIGTYEQYCTAGKQIVTITRPLLNVTNGSHTVALFITSEDAEGTAAKEAYATVTGSGLAASAGWDGTITVTEDVADVEITGTEITVGSFTATPSTAMYIPLTASKTDAFQAPALGATITLPSISEGTAFEAVNIPVLPGADTVSGISLTGAITTTEITETITTTEE